jgi:hypothetical protein
MSGSCVVEYGSMTIIPATRLNVNDALQFHSLNHDAEILTPAVSDKLHITNSCNSCILQYYKIQLKESGTTVEAANDNRAGILRFGLDEYSADKFYLIIMSFDSQYNMSSLQILGNDSLHISNPAHRWYQASGELAGFSGHHYIQFSRAATSYGTITGYTEVHPGTTEGQSDSSGPVAAYFEFNIADKESVMAAVGTSFVSSDKAKANMYAELSASGGVSQSANHQWSTHSRHKGNSQEAPVIDAALFDLEGVVERVSATWEAVLSAIDVEDSLEVLSIQLLIYILRTVITNAVLVCSILQRKDYNATVVLNQKKMVYTGLWHSLFLPRQHSDYDGQYLSFDGSESLMQADGFVYMDDYSTWDVYRATIPLQYLLYPSVAKDMVLSLIAKTEQGGWLPIFPGELLLFETISTTMKQSFHNYFVYRDYLSYINWVLDVVICSME